MKTHCIPGCFYHVTTKEDWDRLKNSECFLATNMVYEKKPWWQFYKRKKVLYYELVCIKQVDIEINSLA